ncbi:hypothetical protein H1R20_g16665, partial [Candolleomyces eurysporus]
MGKKKAANLKTQLGGKLGVNTSEEPGQYSASGVPPTPIITLPSSAFTLENKLEWASSYVDGNGKTHLFVKARSADDPLLANKDILDPYMVKNGHYKNLPNANKLQLPAMNERHNEFTSGALTSQVPGLSIETWECFEIDKAHTIVPTTPPLAASLLEILLILSLSLRTAGTPQKIEGTVKVGKMEIKTYKSREGYASPGKAAFGGNKTYIDWNEKVPVYDGR